MLQLINPSIESFRPLDGESISKPKEMEATVEAVKEGFRPLDGESISKLDPISEEVLKDMGLFPSPRRGINF